MLIASPTAASHPDTVSANTSYSYRVKAVNGAGASADSATDVATTMMFSNDPLMTGVVIQAIHLSQLRTAINYVRDLAGLGAATFTDIASAGVVVKGIHITEIRAALDAALTPLGIPAGGYTDAALAGMAVKAIHTQEIRNRVK